MIRLKYWFSFFSPPVLFRSRPFVIVRFDSPPVMRVPGRSTTHVIHLLRDASVASRSPPDCSSFSKQFSRLAAWRKCHSPRERGGEFRPVERIHGPSNVINWFRVSCEVTATHCSFSVILFFFFSFAARLPVPPSTSFHVSPSIIWKKNYVHRNSIVSTVEENTKLVAR